MILFVGVTGLHKQITNRELTLVRSLCRAKQDDKNKRIEKKERETEMQTSKYQQKLTIIISNAFNVCIRRKRLNRDRFLCLHLYSLRISLFQSIGNLFTFSIDDDQTEMTKLISLFLLFIGEDLAIE